MTSSYLETFYPQDKKDKGNATIIPKGFYTPDKWNSVVLLAISIYRPGMGTTRMSSEKSSVTGG